MIFILMQAAEMMTMYTLSSSVEQIQPRIQPKGNTSSKEETYGSMSRLIIFYFQFKRNTTTWDIFSALNEVIKPSKAKVGTCSYMDFCSFGLTMTLLWDVNTNIY